MNPGAILGLCLVSGIALIAGVMVLRSVRVFNEYERLSSLISFQIRWRFPRVKVAAGRYPRQVSSVK